MERKIPQMIGLLSYPTKESGLSDVFTFCIQNVHMMPAHFENGDNFESRKILS